MAEDEWHGKGWHSIGYITWYRIHGMVLDGIALRYGGRRGVGGGPEPHALGGTAAAAQLAAPASRAPIAKTAARHRSAKEWRVTHATGTLEKEKKKKKKDKERKRKKIKQKKKKEK